MLNRIQIHDIRSTGGISGGRQQGEVRADRDAFGVVATDDVESVADIDTVGADDRQPFLVALPAFTRLDQLVSDGLADNVRILRDPYRAVEIGQRRRTFVIRQVLYWGVGIGASLAGDRADRTDDGGKCS